MTAKNTTQLDGKDAPNSDRLKDLSRDVDADEIDTDQLKKYAKEILDPDGPVVGEVDTKRTRDIAAWIADAAKVPRGDSGHGQLRASECEDTNWRKEVDGRMATIDAGPMRAKINEEGDLRGHLELLPFDNSDDVVLIGVGFDGEIDDFRVRSTGSLILTPDQADAWAAALATAAAEVSAEG